MTPDSKRCFRCSGRGVEAPGWIERDETGMPARICFGRMVDCPDCHGSGRVPKAPKPAPSPDRQEPLWPTPTPAATQEQEGR